VEQSIQYAQYGGGSGQLLDAASHIAGAALGAWLTDRFILSPVITHSPVEGDYVGMTFQYNF